MAVAQLYFNPRCSKARAARDLLDRHEVPYQLVAYLDAPPSRHDLEMLAARIDGEPANLLRTGDPRFADLGLSADSYVTAEAVVDLLVEHPALLERPILVLGDRAIIGRPPERVLELLP